MTTHTGMTLLSRALDTLGAIALEHRVVVALALVVLTVWAWHRLACTLEDPADAKIVWTAPPAHPPVAGDRLDREWATLQRSRDARVYRLIRGGRA